jgi:hypothetical protein
MPFKETIAVYSENHTKPINTLCENAELLNVKAKWYIYLPLLFKALTTHKGGDKCAHYNQWK